MYIYNYICIICREREREIHTEEREREGDSYRGEREREGDSGGAYMDI